MPYCTQQDMIDRFGNEELTEVTNQDDLGASAINVTVLTQAIDDASGLIDGYLSGRYTIPLVTIPPALIRIACDISRYYLYDDAVSDHVEKNYDEAVKFLGRAAKGTVNLGVDNAGAAPQTSNSANMESNGRVFGRKDNGFM